MSNFSCRPGLSRAVKILAAAAVFLLMTAFTLEVALRIIGGGASFLKKLQRGFGKTSGHSSVVLCVGDSFVWGAGGRPFPEQMQELLDEKAGPGKFYVVNAGLSGTGTAVVRKNLTAQLREYSPAAVIVLSGASNYWLYGSESPGQGLLLKSAAYRLVRQLYSQHIRRESDDFLSFTVPSILKVASRGSRQYYRIMLAAFANNYRDSSGNFRTAEIEQLTRMACSKFPSDYQIHLSSVRLLVRVGLNPTAEKIVSEFVSRKQPEGRLLLEKMLAQEGRFKEAAAILDGLPGLEDEKFFINGKLQEAAGNINAALSAFGQGLKLARGNARLKFMVPITSLLEKSGRWGDAIQLYREILALRPHDLSISLSMADIYARHFNDTQSAKQILQEALSGRLEKWDYSAVFWRLKEYGVLPDSICADAKCLDALAASEHPVERDIERDLGVIYRLVSDDGGTLILSSYPDFYMEETVDFAQKNNISYVDLIPVFKRKFNSREEWVAYDKIHCNTAGYRVMAEEYAARILELCPVGKCRK